MTAPVLRIETDPRGEVEAPVRVLELPAAGPEALAAWERAFVVVHEVYERYAAPLRAGGTPEEDPR